MQTFNYNELPKWLFKEDFQEYNNSEIESQSNNINTDNSRDQELIKFKRHSDNLLQYEFQKRNFNGSGPVKVSELISKLYHKKEKKEIPY